MRLWLISLGVAAWVQAAPSGELAKQFYQEGRAAYDGGDYERALEAFELTFMFAASPNAAFNIAATLERLERYHQAAVALERHQQLADGPAEAVHKRAEANRQRAGDAQPTPPPDEARRAFSAGRYAFEHKDFPTATQEFLRSYLCDPRPQAVFATGEALEAAGRFRRAASVFDRFLELTSPKTDAEREHWEQVRARADAIRFRKEAEAPARENPPPREATPVREEAAPAPPPQPEHRGIALVLHGPAFNPDKERRCIAAVQAAGIEIDLDSPVTAVLTLGKKNRLQVVHRDRGIVRDEERPRWGMEQLCVDAAQQAASTSQR
jgi:hypothetical protein